MHRYVWPTGLITVVTRGTEKVHITDIAIHHIMA